MGILSWWSGNKAPATKPDPKPEKSTGNAPSESQIPGMNGAMEVPRRPTDATVFEFGSVAASADKVTLAGFCPVSDDLEPCRWEILPSTGEDAPQFRVMASVVLANCQWDSLWRDRLEFSTSFPPRNRTPN